jgi:hypothetical protein
VSRYGFLAGLALMASCASAGSEGPADAPAADARRPADAAIPIDAPMNVCPSAATCQTAMTLGQVSGDTGNMKLTAMGYQSAWFRVRVTEDNNDIIGLTLRGSAKLTSPSAADFDVFVYVNAGSDVIECTTTTGTTTTNGTVNQVRAEWGEGTIPNGSNDSRHMSIEVRPISGTCAPNQMWQLEVEGNWN